MGTWPRWLAAATLVGVAAACSGGGGPSASEEGPTEAEDGSGDELAALVATEDKQGSFMTPCEWSHSGPDDPIVHAGHPGASHLHEFFGATTTDASSTPESLRAGGTTCRSQADRSAYWVPALLVDGDPVHPAYLVAYYRVPVGADARQIEVPPTGLEMLAGDPEATEPQDLETAHWACGGSDERSPVPVPCWPGAEPVLRLTFPPCWDGENLRSAGHRSHLAPLGSDGACPAAHPVLLPELTLEVRYPDDPEQYPEGELALASGPITGSHGDALLAWEPDFIASEVDACLRDNIKCDVVQASSRLTVNLRHGESR